MNTDNTYFIVDIETCPIDLENYEKLDEAERLKLLNPIDSKIIAIGVKYKGQNKIFMGEDESKILTDFWNEWRAIQKESNSVDIVGFNINNFDLPFLTTRSFIHNVEISPFLIKHIIELRDKINAYRYGKTKGKLKDFARLMELSVKGMDGSDIANLWIEKKYEVIKEYLMNDLEITDEIFKRARSTKIIHINRW